MAKNLLLGNSCHNCEKFMKYNKEFIKNNNFIEGRCGIREPDDLPKLRFCKYWESDEWLKHI